MKETKIIPKYFNIIKEARDFIKKDSRKEGNKMIQNPIITGCNPDPSILRVGDIYYIACSSFEWFPGIPIYKSYDLKNWELINHAIKRRNQADLLGMDSATGVWAPALSYNQVTKEFYLTYSIVSGFSNNNFDINNYAIKTDNIEGEWSDAIYLNSSGFDPSMFQDTDGKSYLVSLEWEFRCGYEHPGCIIIQEYDKEDETLIGNPIQISRGATERGCIEGPHIYKRNGYYYLILAEGGTGYGHCVTISRAETIFGPYIPYENNPILTSQPYDFSERGIGDSSKPYFYNPNSILQKSGHGSIVETVEGETFIVHLCSRPFPKSKRSVLGRETAIQKCEWTMDNWIKLTGDNNLAKLEIEGSNISEQKKTNDISKINSCKDEFIKGVLPVTYYTLRESVNQKWCFINGDKNLILIGRNTLFSKYEQSLVAKKVKSFEFEAETCLKLTYPNHLQMAGLVYYYNNNNFYALRMYYSESLGGIALGIMKADQGIRYEYREHSILIDSDAKSVNLHLRVIGEKAQFSFAQIKDEQIADGEKPYEIIGPKLDSSILSDEYAGGFTGSFVGIFAQDLYQKKKEFEFEYFMYHDK